MIEPSDDIKHAELDWDADGQPLSRTFGDVYFSRANGLEETRHVFLQHNRLPERFAQLNETNNVFCIGETGFGSGLNFLAAWQMWSEANPPHTHLHFISTEKYPLTKVDLVRALTLWPELENFSQQLLAQYPLLLDGGFHRLIFDEGRVVLTLIIDDAAAGFAQVLSSDHPHFADQSALVDAWFLDGFSPAKNPRMWSAELFSVIGQLSRVGTTAATFSAAGIVKQGLRSAGFAVKKVPGFGRKREMVYAEFTEQAEVTPLPTTRRGFTTPWALIRARQLPQLKTAVVIGGGLAGCHSARALALRGWQVTIVERHSELAQGASGNPQGVLYAKISHKQESLAAFNLASLQFALRHYRAYWNLDSSAGEVCGVLQLAHNNAEQDLQQHLQNKYDGKQELMCFVDAAEASKLAGIALQHSAMFFPDAGWLDPRAICKGLTAHPNIKVLAHTEVLSLTHTDNHWQVSSRSECVAQAAVVIVANAVDALQFEQTHHLPLKNIRGQVSYLPATVASRNLKTVVCAEGYLAPAVASPSGESMHCAGATFNIRSTDVQLHANDHEANLGNLRQCFSGLANEWRDIDTANLTGRVGFRCASPDYLPLIGPAPKIEEFRQDYARLRKDARAAIPRAGAYWPNLYINVGHGSRGLAYTPLCAELLAAQIALEPLPVSRSLAHALNPARFVIRDLYRNKH